MAEMQSLARGLRVLDWIGSADHAMGITEMANIVGLDKSSVSRLVQTLVKYEYVQPDTGSRGYVMGKREIRQISWYYLNRMPVREKAKPYLYWLVEETGECAHTAVYSEGRALMIDPSGAVRPRPSCVCGVVSPNEITPCDRRPIRLDLLCGDHRPHAEVGLGRCSKERTVRTMRLCLLVVCALALASNALAQTKISGTLNCNKAELSYAIPIPDLEGYAFSMNQNKCTWSRGFSIQGLQPAEFINTPFIDIEGASGQITAKGVNRYDNGDKTYSRSTGISDLKASTSSGKWTFTGGTGDRRPT